MTCLSQQVLMNAYVKGGLRVLCPFNCNPYKPQPADVASCLSNLWATQSEPISEPSGSCECPTNPGKGNVFIEDQLSEDDFEV